MKSFQTTCLMLAILVLSLQSVRHCYVKYFEQTASVLDKYEKKELDIEIEKAGSLTELAGKYEVVQKREAELDVTLAKQEKEKSDLEREALRREFHKEHAAVYQQASRLRSAIKDWETKSKEIRELRLFWGFGFLLVLIGGLLYRKSAPLGMAFLVPGVVEMIWWTSPSFRLTGAVQEFERLLTNKLVFTNITLALVIVLWLIANCAGCGGRSKKDPQQPSS